MDAAVERNGAAAPVPVALAAAPSPARAHDVAQDTPARGCVVHACAALVAGRRCADISTHSVGRPASRAHPDIVCPGCLHTAAYHNMQKDGSTRYQCLCKKIRSSCAECPVCRAVPDFGNTQLCRCPARVACVCGKATPEALRGRPEAEVRVCLRAKCACVLLVARTFRR
jgi:hypothetical protein